MYNIVYVLKKYSAVRALLFVVLSLAMAVLVGQGLHPAGTSDQPGFVQAPARAAQPAAATANNATAATRSSGLADVSSLDQALKNMGSLERDRNSASAGNSPQMPVPPTENESAASNNGTVKTLANLNKKGQPTGQPTPQGNPSSVPNK